MNINDFFETTHKEKKKVLFLDFANYVHRLIFPAHMEFLKSIVSPNQEVDKNTLYVIWKNMMINQIFNHIKQFNPDKVIIAIDCKYNWRKKFYPDYKDGRQEKKDAGPVDWKEFYPIVTEFTSKLKSVLTNVHVFQVDDCEADDIIAILTKDVFNEEEVTIISTDRDFRQLLKYPHVKNFNPDSRVNDYVSSINPVEELNIKVMCGDKGDNIDNVLVMQDYEHLGKNKIGVGDKAALNILEDGLDHKDTIDKVYDKYNEYDKTTKKYDEKISREKITQLVKENYQRNLKLISFDEIPIEIKNKIIDEFKAMQLSPLNTKNVYNFLMESNIRKAAEDFQIYSPVLKKLG